MHSTAPSQAKKKQALMTDVKKNGLVLWLMAGLNLEVEQYVSYLHLYTDPDLVITELNYNF